MQGEKNWRTWRKTLGERSKAKNRTNQDLCTCTMLGPGFQPGTMVHVLAFKWDFICYFMFITERNIFLAIFDLKEGSAKGNSYHGKLSSYGSKCYNTREKEPRNPCSSIKEIWFTISRRENHEDRHENYVCLFISTELKKITHLYMCIKYLLTCILNPFIPKTWKLILPSKTIHVYVI